MAPSTWRGCRASSLVCSEVIVFLWIKSAALLQTADEKKNPQSRLKNRGFVPGLFDKVPSSFLLECSHCIKRPATLTPTDRGCIKTIRLRKNTYYQREQHSHTVHFISRSWGNASISSRYVLQKVNGSNVLIRVVGRFLIRSINRELLDTGALISPSLLSCVFECILSLAA